ncbi:uncharacterized protein LOC122367039 [Amphibalanus amphitrite]|uniref:uncharacterized protein LOC122367039 n=1 Tax=Amphibalanus amphitrite TaxID=1232801 RepID=UPI001C902DB1|nr:uncharacterized protein LOC122367039 [Amphibalanus amphitrite]
MRNDTTTHRPASNGPPTTGQPAERPPMTDQSADQPPAPSLSADRPRVTSQSVNRPPATGQSVDRPPATNQSVDRPPATSQFVDRPPATGQSVDRPPATSQSVDRPPATSQFVDRPPATGQSVDRPPATGQSADQPPGMTTNGMPRLKSGLSFRFPDTDKRFPPPAAMEVECKLKKLKQDVVRCYKKHHVSESNVTESEMQFLDEIQKNDNVVVKQSDKCKGLIIMDRTEYVNKSHAILDDRNNYEAIDKNPVPKVEAECKRIFKDVSRDKLPEGTIKELIPNHSRTPVFYGVPKDHKEGVPLRPVISACGGPTEKMSCLLERVLKQLLQFVPTHLWDTEHFLKRLDEHTQEQGIPKGSIFFSIDVVNLYGSIPISEAIDAVCDKLATHLKDVDTFGLSVEDIRKLLQESLTKNVFSFNNEYYRQTLGIAMGNPCAPPIAILFLDQFERRALEGATHSPSFLVRYIDDYAGVWTHGEQTLKDFLAYLNSLHPSVKFTLDYSDKEKGVPFLDTLVTVEEKDDVTKIETELYIKPMNSGIILHFDSAHPKSTKLNVARNQFKRAIRNSSSSMKERKSVEKIRQLLLKNGYPNHVLIRLLREARGNKTHSRTRRNRTQEPCDGFLTLPYVDERLLCEVKSKVRQSGLNVKLAWTNSQKLKDKLVRSALCKPLCPGGQRCHTCRSGFSGDCTQKNLVYEITCTVCQSNGMTVTYVGETKRPVRLRFNEHLRDALNKTHDTPMGDHFQECHSTHEGGIPLKVRVLYKSKDHPDRKIAESLLIQKKRPKLNSNMSSWPIL